MNSNIFGGISYVTLGFILWVLMIIFYKIRLKKAATLKTALFLFLECQALIIGPAICLGSFIGWPKFNFEESKWVIGLGGIALFWVAFEQVKGEFLDRD